MPDERDSAATASGSRFARALDGLIPAELHADPEAQLRGRVLVAASLGLGVLAMAANVVRLLTVPYEGGVLVAFAVIAVMFALPFVQRATGSYRVAGGLLVVACALALPAFHVLLGIFPAPAAVLFGVVPLIAAFFVGPGFGHASAVVLAVTVVLLRETLVAPVEAQMVELSWTYVALTAVAPLMTSTVAAAYERARARSQARLEATNAALRAAQAAAEAANRGKTEFLRHISHELRTPLNAILGYGELIEEQLREEGNPVADDAARLRGAGDQLLGLIGELLDISRIEAGAIDLTLAEVDPLAVLAQVRDTALPLAAANHNTLVLAAPDALPRLRTDEQRLRQVLLNLVGNACKFTERGRVVLAAEAGVDCVLFRVRDTGVGMSAEQIARLFEPFVQVHVSAERRRQGSGLGLALSRRLVEVLGGDISVTSEPGRGAQFTVRLPLRAPEQSGRR